MSDDEDFVLYGTSLEPIEEDEVVKKKPRSVEDQVAKDKHGRRRFHGAFTGGFSAGYFNSVGSAEGWTPSAFKSSRGNKFQSQSQKPEDFMDDEDVGEFGIAPKVLRLKGDYDDGSENSANKKRKHFTGADGPIPGQPVLYNLFKPVRSTIGVKLLKKMGWKVGQGVGPRLKKHEKRKLGQQNKTGHAKIYGCALPIPVENEHHHDSSESDDNDEEDNEDITFAPDDYDPYIVKPKDNFFGIGYSGLDRRSILSSHINLFEPSFTVKEKSKKFSIRGKGFGVGALEEEDEDIYSHEDMSQYDFSLESSSSTSKKQQNKQLLAITSCNEPIEGFVAANFVIKKKFFPLPKLPPGYQPIHSVKKSRFEPAPRLEDKTKKQGLHRHDLSASERAIILDEPLPRSGVADCKPSTSSVDESLLVSNEDSNELQLLNIKKEPADNESINNISAGNVFKPFVSNPEKQKRYEQYLKLVKNSQKDKLSVLQPLSMTEWERERERVEFEQAERLYRPISAVFNDRFVSASLPDDATNPLAEVQRTIDEQKDLKEAAKMKMFGKLTRKVYSWAPSSLLCKRFNIREPNSTKEFDGKPVGKKRPKFSVFNFLEAATTNAIGSSNVMSSTPENNTNKITSETSVKPIVSNNESNDETLSIEKNEKHTELDVSGEKVISGEMSLAGETNKEDLYKAIFLSSSDESEGEEQATEINKIHSDEKRDGKLVPANELSKEIRMDEFEVIANVQQSASVANILRNTSPPRGIFANLDLDLINSRKSNNPNINANSNTESLDNHEVIINVEEASKDSKNSDTEKTEIEIGSSVNSSLLYGPKLPSALSNSDKTSSNNAISIKKIVDYNSDDSEESSDEWVESNTISKKNKNKKKKLKKDHKHKKHKKHKKHRH